MPSAQCALSDRDRVPVATILLAEDEAPVRLLFATGLRRAGYTVHEAGNGCEALHIYDSQPESIDLVLTDLRMPLMGGLELTTKLRERRRTIKVICISGFAGGFESDSSVDFLSKPLSRADLLRKVREVLDRP